MSPRAKESSKQVTGSRKAKQSAAVILEVFAGIRGAQEAGEALGVSPNRYYQLEARGLKGMVEALEPRPRGRRRRAEDEIVRLTGEKERLEREVGRLTSLIRASRRSLGVSSPKRAPKNGRSRRRGHRGKKVVAMLVRPCASSESEETEAS